MKKLLSILLLCFCFSATAQNSSTIQQLLDEGVTVGELLGAGVTPDELYGMEYEGGLIFDVDSANGKGKIAYNPNTSKNFQCFIEGTPYPYQYPEVETSADDGMQNTINFAQVCPTTLTASSYALNYKSEEGFDDWYLPTKNEAQLIYENLSLKYKIVSWPSNIHTSELSSSVNYWVARIGLSSYPGDIEMSFSTEYRHNNTSVVLVREFDLGSPTTDELSPALESFLETYTPPVVEEEVVSDANSFDVLNPLSYNGEFESVHYDFSNGEYVVPQGKTLIISHVVRKPEEEGSEIFINNVAFVRAPQFELNSVSSLRIPVSISSGSSITANLPTLSFHGVLINKIMNSIHHNFENGDYIVPQGKSLIMTHNNCTYGEYTSELYIDGVYLHKVMSAQIESAIENPIIVGESKTLHTTSNATNFHGILVDNSNYTYATDYELIDALNEGMDSLSTMSEMVVLENDSISSQNTILSQENEALMAIDYNFDSLQYVADFLSSQVFELQQELLVPNIDVDMAIGWNMVGFSCPQQKTAEDALLSIVDEIIIFKDNSGNVYMPEFSFNGIGDLTPGHGYQLKVTDYILDFNICE